MHAVNQVVAVSFVFAAFLFGGMLLLLELGRRWGTRRLTVDAEGAREGIGVVDGAVFALLGLLLAFTFSGAAARFDERRALIVQEVNDISTAWLRLDVLPAEVQPTLRENFRRYVDLRLEIYRNVSDPAAEQQALARSSAVQSEIWNAAVAGTRGGAAPSAPMLLLPALNAMFDIATTRAVARKTHPPLIIFVMLAVFAYIGSFLAGYGMAGGKARSWIHMIGFAATVAGAVYVIIDLEFPRSGLIRIDAADQMLVELRQSMK